MARSLFFWFGALLALALWIGYNRLQDGALGHRMQQLRAVLNDHLPFGWGDPQPKTARTVLYHWTDADGVEHLSDRPQRGAERIMVDAPRAVSPAPVVPPAFTMAPETQQTRTAQGQLDPSHTGDERPDLFGIRQSLEKKLQDRQDQHDRQINRDSGY